MLFEAWEENVCNKLPLVAAAIVELSAPHAMLAHGQKTGI
jgi:hypothetical protein